VNPLVAEPQCGSNVTKRCAALVQAPHRTVELTAGHFGVVLSTDQPLPGLPGLTQQLVIHAVYRI
jgi:hypothetical protein